MMDFSMRFWKKHPAADWPRAWRFALLLLLLWPLAGDALGSTDNARAEITSAYAEVRGEQVMLDLRVDIALSESMHKALENGIALEFVFKADIGVAREWLWDKNLAKEQRRYKLAYHALSENWLLIDLTNREARTFSNLNTALKALSQINAWAVAPAEVLPENRRLIGRARVELSVNELPLPLRLPALIDPQWSLQSKWYLWSISE